MASTPQVLAKDVDWLSASPEDQKGYLAHVDPDFAKAAPEEQEAYRQHVHNEAVKSRNAEPTQFEKEHTGSVLAPIGSALKGLAMDNGLGQLYEGYKGNTMTGKGGIVGALERPAEEVLSPLFNAIQTPEKWKARKEEGYGAPYRAASAIQENTGLAPFVNPSEQEEAAKRGATGEIAAGGLVLPLAATAAGMGLGKWQEGAPARYAKKGYERAGQGLAIPTGEEVTRLTGPTAAKDVKLAADYNFVKSDLAEMERQSPTTTKGSAGVFERAGKIYDYMDRLWEQAHRQPIEAHATEPIDNNAVVNAGARVLTRELVESDPTAQAANDFLQRIAGARNLKSADELVRFLNEDLKSPAAQTSYGAAQNLVKKAVLQELRTQIDKTLTDPRINEQGVKEWNRKWGALDNVADRMIQRGIAEAKAEGREPAIPRYLHMYSFFHGIPEGGLGMSGGLAFRPQEVLRGVPSGQMRSGFSMLRRSNLQAEPFPARPQFGSPIGPQPWTPTAQYGSPAGPQPFNVPPGGQGAPPVTPRATPFGSPTAPPNAAGGPFSIESVNPDFAETASRRLGPAGQGGVRQPVKGLLPAPPTPVEWKGTNTPLAPVGEEAQGFKGKSLGGLKAVEEATAPRKAARAEAASKPFAERYSPEEVDEARAILQREVDVLSETGSEVGRRPNLRQREAGSHHANTEEIAGWTATRSGKPMMDVLTTEFKEGPQQLAKALKTGKGKLYEKMVDAAVDWIRSHPEGRPGEEVNFFEGIPGFEQTPEVEVMNPEEATKNASGESEASLEATRSGQKFRIVSERGGNPRPVSAVDARGGMRTNPGERIEVLDNGRWVPYR